MIEIPIRARSRAEYESLCQAGVIEKPLNRHWIHFLPPMMFLIGEETALIIEPVVLAVYWKERGAESRTLRSVLQTHVRRNDKKIVFYLRKPLS